MAEIPSYLSPEDMIKALRGPQSRPSLADMPQPDPNVLRAQGMDQLKRAMWGNLGVDYSPYGKFDDSPTNQQVKRDSPIGIPTFDYLKNQEATMEANQQSKGEPGVDYPLWYQLPPRFGI